MALASDGYLLYTQTVTKRSPHLILPNQNGNRFCHIIATDISTASSDQQYGCELVYSSRIFSQGFTVL